MPSPIFVLGAQRSGTTWLANQLCQHSLAAGVQHTAHYGIHESGYFYYITERFGDLRVKSNFVEFAEVMIASDYFALAGADREYVYSLFGKDYAAIFRDIMDRFAARARAEYWVEKSPEHTMQVDALAALYGDARFVAIVRPVEQVVKSSMARAHSHEVSTATRRYLFILRRVLRCVHHNAMIARFASRNPERIVVVAYEVMRREKQATLQGICDFLNLAYEPAMKQDAFKSDSSFAGSTVTRDTVISRAEGAVLRIASGFFSWLPLPVLKLISNRRRGRVDLPLWFFRLTRSSDADAGQLGHSHL